MFKAKIFIKRRRTILDPQGKAVELGIKSIGFENISEVRVDKYIELKIEEDEETEARKKIDKICDLLLANPHLEDYYFEIEKL